MAKLNLKKKATIPTAKQIEAEILREKYNRKYNNKYNREYNNKHNKYNNLSKILVRRNKCKFIYTIH